MTTVIAINDSNDIFMDSTNNLAIATGLTAVSQASQTSTLAQLEEMILFTTQGMPSLQSVFVGEPNYSLYQAAVVAAIQSINGVIAVTSIIVSVQGGVMAYTAEIETNYGIAVIDG